MLEEQLYLWDETIHIHASETIRAGENEWMVHTVSASDDTHALLIVSSFLLDSDVDDLRIFLDVALARCGLKASFIQMNTGIFLSFISPLHAFLRNRFPDKKQGVIILVNGKEPGSGNFSLDEIRPRKGDTIHVMYRIA